MSQPRLVTFTTHGYVAKESVKMDIGSFPEYRHSRLPSSYSIRLLERVDSATAKGHLAFKVHTRSIDESVLRYHCLSYTWGNPFAHGNGFSADFESASKAYAVSDVARIPIVLDGKVFYVHRNLHEALRTIPATAYSDTVKMHSTAGGEQAAKDLERAVSSANLSQADSADMLIWADAVCIDQSDVTEKSAQVGMMDRIYSNAAYVLAWLGPADEHTDLGLRAADTVITHIDAFEASRISPWLGHDRERYVEAGIPHIARVDWDALASIYQRQWFRRAWVVQEAVLARDLLVYVGGRPVPWPALGTLAQALRRQEGRLGSTMGTRYEPTSGAGVSVEWNAAEMFRWRENMGMARSEMTDAEGEHTQLFCLGQLVDAFWTFRATEPADKIFSVYGLINAFAEEDNGRRATDYGRSVQSVYTSATRRIIREQGSLEILSRSLYSAGRRTGLPGWVPDYSVPAINPIPSTFAASKGLRFEPGQLGSGPEDDDDPRLLVRGIRLGTLSQVTGRRGTGPLDKFTFDPKWLSMVLSLKDLLVGGGRTRPPLAELLWRTLCMNMTYGGFLSAADPSTAGAPDEYRDQFTSFVLLTLMALADRKVLEKNGVDPDDAQAVSAWTAADDPFREELAPALRDLDAIIARDERSAGFMPPSDLVVKFWNDVRCTMARCTPDEGDDSPRDFTVPQAVLEGSSRCVGSGRVCTESRMFRRCFGFASAYAIALGYRQLVAVDDMDLGLAPLPAGAGDEVWILPGLTSPAVLRRTEDEGEEAVFSLIGCCYIHGLMHGQAVDEAKAKGEKLVDIVLI